MELPSPKRRKLIHTCLFVVFALLCTPALKKLELMCVQNQIIQEERERKSREAKKRFHRIRRNWCQFKHSITKKHFNRMFRMPVECFDLLCKLIESNVGPENFRSEEYITYNLDVVSSSKSGNIYKAHKETSGGYICGEVKLAITLRILAGASYLDIACIFNVNYTHVYAIFHHVLMNWLCSDFIYKYELIDIINDENKMFDVAKHFASGRNGGTLCGIVGALDGWLVKIKCPSLKQDGVSNSGGYFSRKGFFALNVQVIVDKHKKVLWRRIGARGSEHDSSAFKNSTIHKLLEEQFSRNNGAMHNNSMKNSFYLIGDSAYALRPWLLTPYDNAKQKSPEDTFNFMHSSSRISVECALGELNLRWGIFWRPLKFKLTQHKFIIDAAMRLHNFIVDFREENNDTNEDIEFFQREEIEFMRSNPDEIVGVFGNGGSYSYGNAGRPLSVDIEFVQSAKSLRDSIRDKMQSLGLSRPRN